LSTICASFGGDLGGDACFCSHSFSASSISAINKRPDEGLATFAKRPLSEPFPYLILDARYELVREAGIVANQAVLIAISIDWDGRHQILAVEMANRESRSSWKDFLVQMTARGRHGVEFADTLRAGAVKG
jgi:putative transposase